MINHSVKIYRAVLLNLALVFHIYIHISA